MAKRNEKKKEDLPIKSSIGKKLKMIIPIVVVVAASLFGSLIWYKSSANENKSRQAVFLTTGQVYFGYIDDVDSEIVTLRDVYYMKTTEAMAMAKGEANKISLIKLGSEPYRPEGTLKINRSQILYFQNISSESRINTAIDASNQPS